METRMNEIAAVYGIPGKAEELFNMGVSEAVKALQKEGYDFTEEEITAFYAELDAKLDKEYDEELSEEALEDVAGGFGVGAALAIAIGGSYMLYTAENGYLTNPSEYPPWSTKSKSKKKRK